jgi:tetratricopeptide (TPR) repeat protein
MSQTPRLLSFLLPPLCLAVACNPYRPVDTVSELRRDFAHKLGPAEAARVIVPYELNADIRSQMKKLPPINSELRTLNQVLGLIFERLNLRYVLTPTRTAVETFKAQEGNCLSFVNLFVGLARERGLNPFYVEVTDYQKWNYREGMVVSQGHIVGGMYLDGVLRTFDFVPNSKKAYKEFKPIDDLTATAHYYNNLGAESLLAGEMDRASQLLTVATRIAPKFVKSLNNLGVCQARTGKSQEALATYQKGLAVEPDNSTLLINLTRVYQQLGRSQEASDLLARIEASNTTNPFFFVYQGEVALAKGENDKALDYMMRAYRLDSEAPEVHVAFVKLYLAMGDLEKARHYLERALKLDATNREALKLARLLSPAK